jgi:hypothetical protein
MDPTIKGMVVRIPSKNSVILNVGSEHGVMQGMIFAIYSEGEEIYDVSTRKSLGKFELHKSRVRVTQVQEKFSLAENAEREAYSAASVAIKALSGESSARKLPVDDNEIKPLANIDDRTIRVGDKAKAI